MIVKKGIGHYEVYDYQESIGEIIKTDNTEWTVKTKSGAVVVSHSAEKSKAVRLLRHLTYGKECLA